MTANQIKENLRDITKYLVSNLAYKMEEKVVYNFEDYNKLTVYIKTQDLTPYTEYVYERFLGVIQHEYRKIPATYNPNDFDFELDLFEEGRATITIYSKIEATSNNAQDTLIYRHGLNG